MLTILKKNITSSSSNEPRAPPFSNTSETNASERENTKSLFPKVVGYDVKLVPDLEKYRKRLGHGDYTKTVGDLDAKAKIYRKQLQDNKKSEEELGLYHVLVQVRPLQRKLTKAETSNGEYV